MFTVKVAVTWRAWSMFTWQGPVPAQSPVQPANTEPWSGVAVRVTGLPASKAAWEVLAQAMPAGLEVSCPEPAPAPDAVRVTERRVKVAVTVRAWSIVTWQGPVPAQSPVQPAKTEVASGLGVK